MNQPKYSITKKYKGTFSEATTAITHALSKEGFGILTRIDVKATLKKKLDIDHSPYIILGACSPSHAYKALQAETEIGLLLPCNTIVYSEKEQVYISIMKPTAALTLSNNPTIAGIAEEVEKKLTRALQNAVNSKGGQI